MIVKIPVVLAIVSYFHGVSCASVSKVYVHKGPDYPIDYVQYGTPSVQSQIAQLTAAPVGSVVPYASNYVPCGTPCIYPGQVASITPSANVVQYQSPSLPVIVAPAINEPSGYEYSYVVHDEQTGDHKAQREQSDGTSVRGGYTFLQPDGLVREVQYLADDSQGFNAVVKNYLPVESKKPDTIEKPTVNPCIEVKTDKDNNEHNKQPESSHANLVHTETNDNHGSQPELQEANKGYHEEKSEPNKEHKTAAEALEILHQETSEPSMKERTKPQEKPQEKTLYKETHEHSPNNKQVGNVFEAEIQIVPANQENHVAVTEPNFVNSNVLVSYNDIVRCLQSSLSGVTTTQKPESPLTYIILNKPCYLNKI